MPATYYAIHTSYIEVIDLYHVIYHTHNKNKKKIKFMWNILQEYPRPQSSQYRLALASCWHVFAELINLYNLLAIMFLLK